MHSLLATRKAKQFFNRDKPGEPRPYRLIYNLASLAMFGWVMAAYRQSPLLYAAPGMWRWVFHAGQLLTATIILLCVHQTGTGSFLGLRQFSSTVAETHHLVTGGWYAHVRHPLYLYSTLFLLLNPVMTAQWALLTIFSVTYFIFGGRIEEHRLLQEFGEEYQDYRMQVPFMIPSIRTGRRVRP